MEMLFNEAAIRPKVTRCATNLYMHINLCVHALTLLWYTQAIEEECYFMCGDFVLS